MAVPQPVEQYAFENAAQSCPSCGSPAEDGASVCSACGTRLAPAEEAVAPAPALTAGFECRSCGASVACEPGRSSYACAFCGSTYVVEIAAEGLAGLVPEFVVPFRIDRDRVQEVFGNWCREGFFTPRDVRSISRMDKLQGVYLPFWTFSMRADSAWEVDIGEYWYETVHETYTNSQGKRQTRTRRVQHTEWHPLRGHHHSYHTHHLVSGSRGLPQDEALAAGPFDLLAMRRYRPQLLAGWLAEPFNIAREQALAACQQRFTEAEGERIRAFLPGDTHKGLEWTTQFSEVADDLLLLPFWIGAYTYRGKPYRFVLNGQTGQATGTRPKSPWKIAAVVVLVLAVLLFIVYISASQP